MRQLTKKQKTVLTKYIEAGGTALFWDDLPIDIRETLEAINNTEILWQEAQRFLGDNIRINYQPMWGSPIR